ncbi:MAG: LLM class flavin-dependent oxidoreductase [Myxococcales bacterium]|nr:LLM class flavin-dependent oxidoreductase [Myxococcales bacterium]
MKFSITVQTKIDDWKVYKEIEELGYDAAWLPDTQMVWSDCYATMALAAHTTSRIRLGTGVSIAGTRLAPVTAHSIASINQIAPGRVFIGIGTGHTAMRVMGMDPMRVEDFREYLRVLRALLHGEAVDYTLNGVTRTIDFIHKDLGFRNTEQPVPIYVAANGPRALAAAGEHGDGLIAAFNEDPDALAYHLGMVKAGAEASGRTLPEDFYTSTLTNAAVLRPGETATSDRVIENCGAWTVAILHFVYEIYRYTKNEEMIPEYFHGVWEEYCDHVEKMDVPADQRHLKIHDGHCTFYPPDERRFITEETLRGVCMVGEPAEIADRLHKAEAAGLHEFSMLPSISGLRETMRDFTEVMKIY